MNPPLINLYACSVVRRDDSNAKSIARGKGATSIRCVLDGFGNETQIVGVHYENKSASVFDSRGDEITFGIDSRSRSATSKQAPITMPCS